MSKKKLSLEQRIKLLTTPCKTEKELNNFIKYFFGLQLPDCIVSRYADTNPLNMIWRVYDVCVNRHNPDNIQEVLYVAGRGSGKTLGMAILELLVILHDQREVCHVGAVLAQAKRCYDYQVKFMLSEPMKSILDPKEIAPEDRILQKMNMEKSHFHIGKEHVTLEVLPCTMKALNGPHVPLVVVDEIDTLSGEGLKAIKEVSGMLDSKNGRKALKVGISTRKSRYGLMNQQIENAEREHRSVFRWTAFEFTERCTDERSGTKPTTAYIIQDDMEVIDEEAYLLKDKKKQDEYEKHTLPGEKCMKCPLAAICLGDAKNQKATTPMLKTLDELQQKVRTEGADWALAQLMNLKPSLEGIVYKEFDEKKHVVDWNGMWYKLTGSEFPGECTHDIFVKKCHSMKLPCYAGIDWGWKNPCTVVYYFLDKLDNVYVVRADGRTYISQPEWIHFLKHKYHALYRCQLYFPDTADQGAVHEMRKSGLPVSVENKDRNINTGIQIIKKCLRVPGALDPKIFMTAETAQPLIEEFHMYHFKKNAAGSVTDDPEAENDHWLDALRYSVSQILGKGGLITAEVAGMDRDKIVDKRGNFLHVPNAAEFASINNIQFNDDIDTSKIGKVGKPSELDDDDDDNIGGDGGFLWGF